MLVIGTTTIKENCTVGGVPWQIPKYMITFVVHYPGLLGGGEGAPKITLASCPTCVSKLLDKVGLILSSRLGAYSIMDRWTDKGNDNNPDDIFIFKN